MFVERVDTGEKVEAEIRELAASDFRTINKKRYFFNWHVLKGECELMKLVLSANDDIVGLLALVDYPEEQRLDIRLLTVSAENKGKQKQYDGIAGNLIAYVCRLAMKKYGYSACVSLIPKTLLREHYKQLYGFKDAGVRVYLDVNPIIALILKYDL